MRFTFSWLKDHLETKASVEAISEKLTALGLVVDKIENAAEALASFMICEIVETEKHPNADRLKVCRVNTGEEILQIVCGGPNARKGLKTVLARPGDKIPSTQQALKVGKIRDVESVGMLCSMGDLLLGEDEGGIIELDSSAPIGESYAKWSGLDEVLFEIEITPNRGDCLGVHGVARDLAATGIGTLNPLKEEKVKGAFPCPVSLKVDSEASPHFTGRVIRGVKNGSSPDWLQRRLKAIGLRPISALVDITNFFAYDQARPLHVFDLNKIKGNLTVRLSQAGETFQALDEKTYVLSDDMTVITDQTGVISLAGVIGGMSTGCDDQTQNIFLESAFFDPIRTTITGRALGILSDSRYRFERGVDPASTLPGLEAATQMILSLCGGEASEVVVGGQAPHFNTPILFHPSRMKSLGGLNVPKERMEDILTSLGFDIQAKDEDFNVLPPSWRFDVEHEADIVEEILRVEGYDKIPSLPYKEQPLQKPLNALQQRRFVIRDRLAGRGLTETVTWSFVSQKDAVLFGGVPESLILLNPISQDLDAMRPSLLPHLLKGVLYNQNRGVESVAFFEVGPQYFSPAPQGQHMMTSGMRAGVFQGGNWCEKERKVDAYDAKADALAILEEANLTPQWERTAPLWYHPGRSATLKIGSQVLGWFGEIHPRFLKVFDLKGPVVAFEIFLDRIPLPKRKKTAKPKLTLSPYQVVERDFAFIVDSDIPADALLTVVKKVNPDLIEDIILFDVFELEEGQKSLGIRLRLQPKDHTLTDEEIQTFSQDVIAAVKKGTGGILRQ